MSLIRKLKNVFFYSPFLGKTVYCNILLRALRKHLAKSICQTNRAPLSICPSFSKAMLLHTGQKYPSFRIVCKFHVMESHNDTNLDV